MMMLREAPLFTAASALNTLPASQFSVLPITKEVPAESRDSGYFKSFPLQKFATGLNRA